MKKFFFLLSLIFFVQISFSQEFLDPVKWDVSVELEQGNTYNILMTATLDKGWHTYSQKQFGPEMEGPIPTEFTYNASESTFKLIGDTQEPEITPIYDPVFEMDVIYFSDKVTFIQQIEVINPEGLKIIAEVYYSVCDEEKCLPPDTKTFELDLASGKAETANG